MKKILIFGAGSIGNHMAFACKKLNYNVWVTDINPNALDRMKNKIYPKRYGKWNKSINTIKYNEITKIKVFFDLIIIGTPPNKHLNVYNFCKKNISFKKALIEKPLFHINENKRDKFKNEMQNSYVFCGYNHSVSKSFKYFEEKIFKKIKNLYKIQVKWCEAWDGILNAHFWLKNERDSYLGNYKLGGGALQEHSHGLHLLYLLLKKNKIDLSNVKLKKKIFFSDKNKYDLISGISGFNKNIYFNYITDLRTLPAEKRIMINGKNISAEWICNFRSDRDVVRVYKNNKLDYEKIFKKNRSSEFENEIKHIMRINSINQKNKSNLNPRHAYKIVNIIEKVFKYERK